MENKLDKRSIAILIIVLIATICVSVLGFAYAYFRAIVSSSGTSEIRVTTSNLEITYVETKNIVGSSISPGWSDTKVFSVTNTGDSIVSYNILWTSVTNTLVNNQYLKYSVVGTGTGAFNTSSPVTFPSVSTSIASNVTINPGVVHNYVITINYLNDVSYDQSADMNKTFSASITIEAN